MTQYMQEAGAMKQLTDEEILHLWDTHVAYETGGSAKQPPLDDKDKLAFARAALAAANQPRPFTGALNDIPATLSHDEGAYAQCFYCRRYSRDPKALSDRQPRCDCGKTEGWSGSFKKPGADAKWSGLAANEGTLTAGKQGGDGVATVAPARPELTMDQARSMGCTAGTDEACTMPRCAERCPARGVPGTTAVIYERRQRDLMKPDGWSEWSRCSEKEAGEIAGMGHWQFRMMREVPPGVAGDAK